MRSALLIMILLIFAGNFAAAQSGNYVPTNEQIEAQFKQARQAAWRVEFTCFAFCEAEKNRQAQIKRDAAAAAAAEAAKAAKKSTLVIKTDTTCQLAIKGEDRGTLEAQANQRLPVEPGKQLIECVSENRRVEQTETVGAGRQSVVQLALPPPARFEPVSEGVKDNKQNLIWAEHDNGSDINWTNATQYCSGLGSGWTLPSSAALLSMYDASGKYPVPYVYWGTTTAAKPATALINFTGMIYWTSEQNGASEAWGVFLIDGSRFSFPVTFTDGERALCVRRS